MGVDGIRTWRCRGCGASWSRHPAAPPERDGDGAGKLVLIVDDHDDLRDMLCEAMGLAGLAVAEASAGDEALQKTLELRPDLIILDLSLPRVDGADVTQIVEKDGRTSHIPVIVLTGRWSPRDVGRIQSSGCDLVLRKPCGPDELVTHVTALLRHV
jgi:DNA-binding response OmpR family regulator